MFGGEPSYVAEHFRWLAEQDREVEVVDGLVAEQRIAELEFAVAGDRADDRVEAALARGQRGEASEVVAADDQHVALLRLVAPQLHRTHAGVVVVDSPQVEARADVFDQLGAGVGEAAGADVVDAEDGIFCAQRDAAVDQLLAAALHLGVVALDRGEVEVFSVGAGVHACGGTAAQTDEHGRAAELDNVIAGLGLFLIDVLVVDKADAAGDHDRFVIAAIAPGVDIFCGAEDAEDIGAAEFVAEGRAADGPLGHDVEGRGQSRGKFGVVLFPGLGKAGYAQMRGEECAQARLRPAAGAGRAFVADFATDAGGGPRIGRDGGRMVVGLDLDEDVGLLVAVGVAVRRVGARAEDGRGVALKDARVVRIGLDRALRVGGVGVADHVEERVLPVLAIDDPVGVEDLVAAVLGVDD